MRAAVSHCPAVALLTAPMSTAYLAAGALIAVNDFGLCASDRNSRSK